MDMNNAISALAALAQEARLSIFRLLVRAGPDGLAAGEIGRALSIRHNTLSTHLATLARSGLVSARRDGRSIIYRIDLDGTRALFAWLLEDCCQGTPEACAPAIESLLGAFCEPSIDCCADSAPSPARQSAPTES